MNALTPAYIGVAGTLAGVVVGSVSSLLAARIVSRNQDRRDTLTKQLERLRMKFEPLFEAISAYNEIALVTREEGVRGLDDDVLTEQRKIFRSATLKLMSEPAARVCINQLNMVTRCMDEFVWHLNHYPDISQQDAIVEFRHALIEACRQAIETMDRKLDIIEEDLIARSGWERRRRRAFRGLEAYVLHEERGEITGYIVRGRHRLRHEAEANVQGVQHRQPPDSTASLSTDTLQP